MNARSEQSEGARRDVATLTHWVPSSELGGIEMAALTLIQATPGLRHVVATGDESGPAAELWREAGAEVVQIDGWAGFLGLRWASAWRCFTRLRRVRHLVSWSPSRMTLLLAPLDSSCECVVHLGNVGAFSRKARLQLWLGRLLGVSSCRFKLIACSQAVARSLADEPILRSRPMVVIPNCVRRPFFEIGAARAFNGHPPLTWGMLARLDQLKDHSTLIQAVGLLPRSLRIRVELAGRGPLEDKLRHEVQDAGLSGQIQFLGGISRPQQIMSGWEAFVFSTTPGEGFGIAVAEAMASGLPCVLSDIPALREVAGETAFFFTAGSPKALAERIHEVTLNPNLAERRAQAGRARALELYTPEAFARSYLKELGLSP